MKLSVICMKFYKKTKILKYIKMTKNLDL